LSFKEVKKAKIQRQKIRVCRTKSPGLDHQKINK